MDDNQPSPLTRLIASLSRHRLPAPWRDAPLGLCLSGGRDSSALALMTAVALRQAPESFPGGVVAYHARHGLRGSESEGDATSVRELCGKLGLALVEFDALVLPGPGLEARARQVRYQGLRALAGPTTLLVTAHHREDQSETVWLRLLRGAGVVGLQGIHSLRRDGVWRPWLDIPGSDLAQACQTQGWTARLDASNLDLKFHRNLLRHHILPELESQHPGLGLALAELARSTQALQPFLERALERRALALSLECSARGFSLQLPPQAAPFDVSTDPELDLLLERAWTRCGRRPWATEHRSRLLLDLSSGARGRRMGGQGELAIWGGGKLTVECLAGSTLP